MASFLLLAIASALLVSTCNGFCNLTMKLQNCQDKIQVGDMKTCDGWYEMKICMDKAGCIPQFINDSKAAFLKEHHLACEEALDYSKGKLGKCDTMAVKNCLDNVTEEFRKTCVGWQAAKICLIQGECVVSVIEKLKTTFERVQLLDCRSIMEFPETDLKSCTKVPTALNCVNKMTVGRMNTCYGWYDIKECLEIGGCPKEVIDSQHKKFQNEMGLSCYFDLESFLFSAVCEEQENIETCLEVIPDFDTSNRASCREWNFIRSCIAKGKCHPLIIPLTQELLNKLGLINCDFATEFGTEFMGNFCNNSTFVITCLKQISGEHNSCNGWHAAKRCMESGSCVKDFIDYLEMLFQKQYNLNCDLSTVTVYAIDTTTDGGSFLASTAGLMMLGLLGLSRR